MKRILLRIAYVFAVFIITIIVTESAIGIRGYQTTTDMAGPVLPLITMDLGSMTVNELHGRRQSEDTGAASLPLTLLSPDRRAGFTVYLFGTKIESISSEIRDADSANLIETQEIDVYTEDDGILRAALIPGNLITPGKTYLLTIRLGIRDVGDIRYDTAMRVCGSEDEYTLACEAAAFARSFHETALRGDGALDLSVYLEPDDLASNSDFSSVGIHNSAEQVTWGELHPQELTDWAFTLEQASSETFELSGRFLVRVTENEKERVYLCGEHYQLRRGPVRFYMMDYERTMQELFDPSDRSSYQSGQILLGIGKPQQVLPSGQGKSIAFVTGERLYSYAQEKGEIAYIFGFGPAEETDARVYYDHCDIRALRTEEDGSVIFLVSGYFNADAHEGMTGVACYSYHSDHHTVEELFFIPRGGDDALLRQQAEETAYLNDQDRLHILLGDTLYEIQIHTRTVQIVETISADESVVLSEGGRMAAWRETENGELTGNLVLVDFADGSRQVVEASNEHQLIPMGFIGEDLVYGSALEKEVILRNEAASQAEEVPAQDEDTDLTGANEESSGSVPEEDTIGALAGAGSGQDDILPEEPELPAELIDAVLIIDREQEKLAQYAQKDLYITGFAVQDDQVVLHRVRRQKAEDGQYIWIQEEDDQIVSARQTPSAGSLLTTKSDGIYKRISVLTAGGLDPAGVRFIRPKMTVNEGSREIRLY